MNKKMKLWFFVMIIPMIIGLNSCSKSNSVLPNKMSAKIDGKDWQSLLRTTKILNNTFSIIATSNTGESIEITILGVVPKAYNFVALPPEFNAIYKATASASTQDIFNSANGTVTLTKVDEVNRLISGTFQFQVKNLATPPVTKSITAGQFTDLSYN